MAHPFVGNPTRAAYCGTFVIVGIFEVKAGYFFEIVPVNTFDLLSCVVFVQGFLLGFKQDWGFSVGADYTKVSLQMQKVKDPRPQPWVNLLL